MISVFSGPCEAAREEAYAGDHEPSLRAGDSRLEVFGQASVASEPSESAFDHPAFGLRLECPDPFGSGDDLDRPAAERRHRVAKLVAAVDAVGEDMLQRREGLSQCGKQRHGAVIVLDIGRVHQKGRAESPAYR